MPDIVYRHTRAVRLTHWVNALTVSLLLMSGLQILNAHPRLYWGLAGADFDRAWLDLHRGVPFTFTLPSWRDLATGRRWHFALAWILVANGAVYLLFGLFNGHLRRDLAPRSAELTPRSLWRSIIDHLRLVHPTGEDARRYNILQKLAYIAVIFGLLPLMVASGLAMAPGVDAAAHWLPSLLGGRQSARSIHFLAASGVTAFVVVHLVEVVLAGPINEVGSMITGWYRLPSSPDHGPANETPVGPAAAAPEPAGEAEPQAETTP